VPGDSRQRHAGGEGWGFRGKAPIYVYSTFLPQYLSSLRPLK
jgi:hypothetical protein